MRKILYIHLLAINAFVLVACKSPQKKLTEKIEQMKSTTISIPYEQMECWTEDSIRPWKNAKLKLVHYVDSAVCSSCYLQKIAMEEVLFRMEEMSNYEFYNVFIINPKREKTRMTLEYEFSQKQIPQTIFVDSANIFMKQNPNIPSGIVFHTFLLDENDSIIIVGNPLLNKKIEEMIISVVEKKLGKKFISKNI